MATVNPIADTLTKIMGDYRRAYEQDRFRKTHPTYQAVANLATLLGETEPARAYPSLMPKWSAGKGTWARVPWVALLDSRVTTKVSGDGIYVILLFRADMSGVYMTLNQGTNAFVTRDYLGALARLRARTEKFRSRCSDLAGAEFVVGGGLDLKTTAALAKAYEKAVIAHRLYDHDRLPPDKVIVSDLRRALMAYGKLFR
jgi:MrcB-like, N-terminal domain